MENKKVKSDRFFKVVLACTLCLVFLASFAAAQTSKGSIGGTITDTSDAVITGASVTAKNLDTGEVRTVTTGSNGQYRIDAVELGSYKVTILQKGFAPMVVDKIIVSGSVITSVNAKLRVGTANQEIVVEASNASVQTETGEISQTISTNEIISIPYDNLNPYSLATTLPGVSTVTSGSDFTNGTSYSSDGSRPRANNFMIEGQDNNDANIHGQGLQPENLGSIAEVTVLLNSTSAEYGHGGGAIANIIYKGGTNKFHGAVWDRLSNSSLDANDHNNAIYGISKALYRENIYGFNFGGPIKKDKLFFFTSYQWDHYNSSAVGAALPIPTAAGYAVLQPYAATNPRIAAMLAAYGSLRGVDNQFAPGLIPLGLDPVTGLDRGSVDVGLFSRTGVALDTKGSEFDAKGDYNISKNDTLNLRLIRSPYTAPYDFFNNNAQLPGFDTNQSGTSYNAGITYTHVFSPTLLNELRISYGRIGFWFLLRPDDVPAARELGYSITSMQGWGGSPSFPQGRFHNTYQLQDTVSWTKGKHFLKVGFDAADIRVTDTIPYNYYGTISYTAGGGYTGLADFLDDYSGPGAQVAQTFGSPIVHASIPTQNYFAQDSWKVRPNLTLDFGLRYEYYGTPANQLKYPAIDLANIACYTCVVKEKADAQDIAPRFSFAYTPRFWNHLLGDGKTVVRGGFGVFYDGVFTNILDNTQATSPNSVSSQLNTGTNPASRHVSNWSTYFASLPTTPNGNATSDTQAPHLLAPETLQWNVNIQRELPGKYTLEVGYVGTRGEHLFANTFANPFLGDGVTRLNPLRGTVVLLDNSGDSIYHGAHVQLDRKYSHGFQLRTSYTFSKMIDDSTEVFTAGNWSSYSSVQYPTPRGTYDRSVSAFDHKHRVTITYIYDIPKLKADNDLARGAGYVVNGWQISGTTAFQSGTPYNVETGYDTNGDGVGNDRPSISNPNAPIQTYGFSSEWWQGTPGQVCDGPTTWYDPNGTCHVTTASAVHWIVPPSGQGTFGRNGVIGPWYNTWAFSLNRTIKIHESQAFLIRADMFNPFNSGHQDGDGYWPNFTLTSGILPTSVGTSSFGNFASSVHGARQIRMLLKYSF